MTITRRHSAVGGTRQHLDDDPVREADLPYSRSLEQKPRTISGGTYEVSSSAEITICRIKLEEPALITAYVGIDLFKNNQLQQRTPGSPVVMRDTNGQELFMLGRLRLGCQLTYLDANFDIPAGQIVQLPVMAESFEITARFCGNTFFYLNNFQPGANNYQGAVDPVPLGVAPTLAPPQFAVSVSGFIGQKGPTTGNATRRFRIFPTNAVTDEIPLPNLATHWRFQGNGTSLSAAWSLNGSLTGSLPLTEDWQPIPTGAAFLAILCSAAGLGPYEVAFKLGFDGLGT